MGEEVEETKAALNTDRELYREPTDRLGHEFYQPSIHVTESGAIGINVGGMVCVRPLREWHAAMTELESLRASLTRVEEERDEGVEALRELKLYTDDSAWRPELRELVAKCLSRATSAEGK